MFVTANPLGGWPFAAPVAGCLLVGITAGATPEHLLRKNSDYLGATHGSVFVPPLGPTLLSWGRFSNKRRGGGRVVGRFCPCGISTAQDLLSFYRIVPRTVFFSLLITV